MAIHLLDPQSELDWQHDWTGWLVAGDAIQSRQWRLYDGPDETIGVDLLNATGEVVTIPENSLEVGKRYKLTESILTTTGRKEGQSIILLCVNR